MRRRFGRGLLFLFALLLSACSHTSKPSFEVIGQVDLSQSSTPYSFSDTLNALYSPNGQVVVARVDAPYGSMLEITVDEVILGNLSEHDSILVDWEKASQATKAPDTGKRYLFFLQSDGESYALQQDESGWLEVENGRVLLNHPPGSVSLETVHFESTRIGNTVALPANFYYFWDLNPLVADCDNIFLGTVRSIRETSYTYYVNDTDIRLNLSDDTYVYQLEVQEVYHGAVSEGENIQVLSAPVMMKNTIDYTSQQPITGLKYNNAPPLFEDATYVFFIISSPVSSHMNTTNFFVNPVQGIVPVSTYDQVTYSVPSNPIFTTEYNLEDLAYDIRAEAYYTEEVSKED